MRNIIYCILFTLLLPKNEVNSAPYIIGEYKYIQPNGVTFTVQKNCD